MEEDKAKLKGRVLEAAGMVDYQQGAVVSREVVRGEKGTLSVFAFDRGQGLSEHSAPFDATVLVLDGEAEVVIGGNPLEVGAGEMVVMPADVPHAINARQRFKMMLIMIRE